MINGAILDLWEAPYPRFTPKQGNIPYNHRLVWCSLPHITRFPFYCNELVRIIEEAYDEKLHPFTVASFLKKLANLGYIERIPLICDTAQYQYTTTQLYRNYWKEEAM